MNQQEAYNLLVDHNCAGPCPCDKCKEAKEVLKEKKEWQSKLDGYVDSSDTAMSNCNHNIEEEAEVRLKNKEILRHAAWNFNGNVWYYDGLYYEAVNVYHQLQEILSAPSLKELMNVVNDKYGWD